MITKDKLMIFREGDEGGSGGGEGGGETASRGDSVFEEGGSGGEDKGQQQQEPQQQQQPAPFDPKAFAETFKDALAPLIQQGGQQQQQQQLSPEELKKAMKVWEPGKDWFAKFDNLETREAAILEMRDALLQQFDVVTQLRLRDHGMELEGKFKPALEYVTRAEIRDRDRALGERYPMLGKPELKPMVTAIMDQFKTSGRKFDSEEQMFDAVKDAVEAVGKQTNPNFKIDAGSTPASDSKTKGQPTGGLRSETPGSGGGGGGKGSGEVPKKRGLAVFAP